MYLIEKMLYQGWFTEEGQRIMNDPEMKAEDKLMRETGWDKEGNELWGIHKSISEAPRATASLYAQNDRFLDFCTPFSERRGLITMTAIAFSFPVLLVLHGFLINIISKLFSKHGLLLALVGVFFSVAIFFSALRYFKNKSKKTSDPFYDPMLDMMIKFLIVFAILIIFLIFTESEIFEEIIPYILSVLLFSFTSIAPFFYFIGLKKFGRLEIFVQRRALVRFDRVNRKVYLHRPKYAGGVVALNWDDLMVDVDPRQSLFGIPLLLQWSEEYTPHGVPDTAFVGRNARSHQEMENRWEFIRRFMEEGPQSIPREKLLSKFTWPWNSLIAVSGMVWPLFTSWLNWFMLIGGIFLIPAMLFYSIFHWISLLLCWEPVFPREIREACGESSQAVIKARLVDLVAWMMLAALVWWVFWPLMQVLVFDRFIDT